jgi:hypothetical protein
LQIAARVTAGAIMLGVLGGVAWFLWWQPPGERPAAVAPASEARPGNVSRPSVKPRFRCDARTQCEQMTSCEEAMFFLKNCPATTALDQDKDGIPCEVQWCQK